MAPRYSRADTGELVVEDATTGGLMWRGLPAGRAVASLLLSPSGDGCVVLAEFDIQIKNDRNLFCVAEDGRVVWIAETPDRSGADAYVSARVLEGRLVANSWSGYRVELDWRTGDLLRSEFVK